MSAEPDGVEYALVMPFVVCQSVGGPYDDDAFVAGYQAGQIDAALKAGTAGDLSLTVRTDLLPQLDLIAMRHGYIMTTDSTEIDEWTYATFRRPR